MKLRCYCCGEEVSGGMFALVTLAMPDCPVDRVFIFLLDHVERVDSGSSLTVARYLPIK